LYENCYAAIFRAEKFAGLEEKDEHVKQYSGAVK
jgi:hypothetical protein